MRICTECQAPFEGRTVQKTCSKACNAKRDNRKKMEYYHRTTEKKVATCPCGVTFSGRLGIYCSPECRSVGRAKQCAAWKRAKMGHNEADKNGRYVACKPETAQAIVDLIRRDPEARLAFELLMAGKCKMLAGSVAS